MPDQDNSLERRIAALERWQVASGDRMTSMDGKLDQLLDILAASRFGVGVIKWLVTVGAGIATVGAGIATVWAIWHIK